MAWSNPSTRSTGYKVTSANWNEIVGDLLYLAEVDYTEFTSDVTINGGTVGAANQIVSSGAITYTAEPILIEFFSPRYTATGSQQINVILKDGATVLGTIAAMSTGQNESPIYTAIRITPTAGSHTYKIAAWTDGGGGCVFKAGTGGAAGDGSTFLPGWIRITRIPT